MLTNIRGLKYPDEYFIKFFFKNRLHEKENLKYLEFGCGNGSNLMLPYQYGGGNQVIGIDYDTSLIKDANYNFKILKRDNSYYKFYADDMRNFVKQKESLKADVLILASSIYYIYKDDFISFLISSINNFHIKKNIHFYIRIRTTKDFRYGLGKKVSSQTYKLPDDVITNEGGATITFYTESEIINILIKYFNLRDYSIFHVDNQNEQNGEVILNSDIVIWGTIN